MPREKVQLGNRAASKGTGRMGTEITRMNSLQLRLEITAETKFTELNNTMSEYNVFRHKLSHMTREPILSDFTPPEMNSITESWRSLP